MKTQSETPMLVLEGARKRSANNSSRQKTLLERLLGICCIIFVIYSIVETTGSSRKVVDFLRKKSE